jgi:hypothetical protein
VSVQLNPRYEKKKSRKKKQLKFCYQTEIYRISDMGDINTVNGKKFLPRRPGFKPGLVMWNFVMDKSGAGAGFLRELRFPLPI